ncbi:hypothetical protein ACPRNU_21500 [Chromobacterium vaccinii]|uniref:hypothetical protein n=1 Tax=Chromobacterium vaccinii TaxID=1108595 RepID=UPI003C77D90C
MSNVTTLFETKIIPAHVIHAASLPQELKDKIFNQAFYISVLHGNGDLAPQDGISAEANKALDDLAELMRKAEHFAVIEERPIRTGRSR